MDRRVARRDVGVIFDVDGVLVASPHERAWREALEQAMRDRWHGLATSYHPGAFTSEVYQSRVAGRPRQQGALAVLRYFGVPESQQRAGELGAAKQARLEALIAANEFTAFDDALALVMALLRAGHPLAAASSSRNADAFMARVDLLAFCERARVDPAPLDGRRTLLEVFDVNVCGRDAGPGKPDPGLFLLAAAELGLSPAACVVVEDAPAGVGAARAGGMRTLGVARLHDEALLVAAGADVVVSRLCIEALAPLLAAAEAAARSASPPEDDARFAVTPDENWVLRETRYHRSIESSVEARFAISNGFLGVRASRAVSRGPAWISWQHTQSWASWPRTYVAGLFDTPNADPPVPALVPAPDWMRLRIVVDGAPLQLRLGELVRHARTLDMRRGVLITEWQQRLGDGRTVRLRTLRLVSLAARAVAVQVAELVVDGAPASVALDTIFEVGSTGLELVAIEPDASRWRTGTTCRSLGIAHGGALTLDGEPIPPATRGQCATSWRWTSRPGQRALLTRVVAFARGDDLAADVLGPARAAVAHASAVGFDTVLDRHAAAWRARWLASDIEIEGDDDAQRALRFAAYHLVGAANPEDDRVSIGARALTGDAYLGHVFWDTEVYLLPFYTLTWPEAARALLRYRHRTLDGARAKARRMGYRGALYAWESADTGEEVTPEQVVMPDGRPIEVLCGRLEQHISADIAYAVWQYWLATGDDDFLRDTGAEILLETARFWASRAQAESDGQHHIRDVIGPDEYHEHVDDNAFTNGMARWNLERGVETAALLRARWPERWQALERELAITAEELVKWREVAATLVTGFDPRTRLFEQFAGYFDLEEIDLAAYAGRTQPMDVVLGRERTQASRVVKQADVVALLAMLPEAFAPDVHRANFEYYERRCGHGSSLSRGLHALVAARLGDTATAYRYFRETAATDLADSSGATAGGVRIAALGGLWQAAVLGFAGIRPGPDGLAVEPHLPREWRAMRLRMHWRGRVIAFRLAHDETSATLERGEPLSIALRGVTVTLEPEGTRSV